MKEIFKAYNLSEKDEVLYEYWEHGERVLIRATVVFNEFGQKVLDFNKDDVKSYIQNPDVMIDYDFRGIVQILRQSKLRRLWYQFTRFRKTIWSIVRHTWSHRNPWSNNFDERFEICKACDWKDIRLGVLFCGDCGCSMPLKARFGGADCPQGKWDKVEEKGEAEELLEA